MGAEVVYVVVLAVVAATRVEAAAGDAVGVSDSSFLQDGKIKESPAIKESDIATPLKPLALLGFIVLIN